MSAALVVRAEQLTKFYGKRCGVENVSFDVEPGEVVGFLGPNGSGKTTVLRMLMGLISITSGRAELFGRDVTRSSSALRARVGYLPGTLGLYDHLTARQYFIFLSELRRTDCATNLKTLCQRFSLDPNLRIKTMSKGTKQKVGLIQAFMHQPDVLILDEPTSGLDPLVQHEFEHLLRETRERGASVILSSHILSEVEKLAHRVVILNNGQLLANETVESLPGHDTREVVLDFEHPVLPAEFHNITGFRLLSCSERRISGLTTGSQRPLLEAAVRHDVMRIQSPEPSLDALFRQLVSNSADNSTGLQ